MPRQRVAPASWLGHKKCTGTLSITVEPHHDNDIIITIGVESAHVGLRALFLIYTTLTEFDPVQLYCHRR